MSCLWRAPSQARWHRRALVEDYTHLIVLAVHSGSHVDASVGFPQESPEQILPEARWWIIGSSIGNFMSWMEDDRLTFRAQGC